MTTPSGDEAPVKPGDVLAGKYRVERVLGAGGMGVVVAATHVQLGEAVALKFLLPGAVGQGDSVARFLREAQAAVRIKSEHVARVTDMGTLETGAPYLVMEHLRGTDLSDLLRDGGPLPIPDAVDYVLQASVAIAEAHALGIVHRDLKPSNLFLTKRIDGSPLVKVLDFGIAKAMDPGLLGVAAASLTATNAMMGSPLYMSPEQIKNAKTVDGRSDIWSLGVILQELVSGSAPFLADTYSSLLASVMFEEPKPLRSVLPTAPLELENVILRCLQKDAANRYASVGELAKALEPFAPARSRAVIDRATSIAKVTDRANEKAVTVAEGAVAATPRSMAPLPPITNEASGVATVNNWGGNTPKPPSRSPALYAALGVGAVVVLTVAVLAVRAFSPPRAPADAASADARPSATPTVSAATAPSVTVQPVDSSSPTASASPTSAPPPTTLRPPVIGATPPRPKGDGKPPPATTKGGTKLGVPDSRD